MPNKLIFPSVLLSIGFLFWGLTTYGHGIIIAHEKQQIELFNADSSVVNAFADSLILKYDKVILHLGNSNVFANGNIFTSEKSKTNLKLFGEKLRLNNIPLTLWFFDSFGKESFKKIYAGYRGMCDGNLKVLDSLNIPYKGIVIDLEWINYEGGENNSKLEELLTYLRGKINKEHQLYFFSSLHETKKENIKRGFDTDRLSEIANAPIAMLYPSDAGFYIESQKIRPYLDDKRIKVLVQFYDKKKWEVAVSLEGKWICQLKHDLTEMELLSSPPEDNSSHLKADQTVNEEYWNIKSYVVTSSLLVNLEKGKKIILNPGDKLYHYTINRSIIAQNYYVYEFFHLQNDYSVKE